MLTDAYVDTAAAILLILFTVALFREWRRSSSASFKRMLVVAGPVVVLSFHAIRQIDSFEWQLVLMTSVVALAIGLLGMLSEKLLAHRQ